MNKTTQTGALLALVVVTVACGGERYEGTAVAGEAPPVKTQVVGGDPDGGGYRQPFLRLANFQEEGAAQLSAGEDAGTSAPDAGSVEDGTLDAFTVHTVRWESHGIEWVRIDVSQDEGSTWDYLNPEAERIPAAQGSFTFTVPGHWTGYGNTRPLRFRVADADKPESYSATSSRAVVRCCDTLVIAEARQGTHSTPGGDFLNPALPVVDPRGAFVEIVSRSRFPTNITGWRLLSAMGWTGYTFPSAIIPPGGVVLVWGGPEAPPVVPPNVRVFVTPTPETLVRPRRDDGWPQVAPGTWWDMAPPAGTNHRDRVAPHWESKFGPMVAATITAESDPALFQWPSAFVNSSDTGGRYYASPGYRADGLPYGSPLDVRPLGVVTPVGGAVFAQDARTWACRYGVPFPLCDEMPGQEARGRFRAEGGVPPYRFDVEEGASLPPGTRMEVRGSSYSGVGRDEVELYIHGDTKWADGAGPDGVRVAVTLRITDSSPFPKRVRVPVEFFAGGENTIQAMTLPDASVGRLYEASIDQIWPYWTHTNTWTVTEGTLPPGVRVIGTSIYGTGVRLGGAPTKPGTYSVTVTVNYLGAWDPVTDASTPRKDSRTLAIVVR